MNAEEKKNTRKEGTEYREDYKKIESELKDYLEIPVVLHVLIGKRKITVAELLNLRPGSIVDLYRSAGESLLLYLNRSFFAKGEATVIEDTFGVRITGINDPREVGSD